MPGAHLPSLALPLPRARRPYDMYRRTWYTAAHKRVRFRGKVREGTGWDVHAYALIYMRMTLLKGSEYIDVQVSIINK